MNAIMQSANLYNTPDDQLGYGIPNYTLANALLSIEDETNSFLSVYPNPLKNYSQLYAFVANAENIIYSLYNIKGKLLAFQEVSSSSKIIQIDIPSIICWCIYTRSVGRRAFYKSVCKNDICKVTQ